jgi:hypothetical protein
MKFLRKILNASSKYGTISLPKQVFDIWTLNGFTHVEMLFDEKSNTLIISPLLSGLGQERL